MAKKLNTKQTIERLFDMGLIEFDYVPGEASRTIKCVKTGKVIAEIYIVKKALVIKDQKRWDELTIYAP